MEHLNNVKRTHNIEADVNANDSAPQQINMEGEANGFSSKFKNQTVTVDGQTFYPCQFCNKVFLSAKTRTFHVKKCSAKDYILSVANGAAVQDRESTSEAKVKKQQDISVPKKSPAKIDIQQHIVLHTQLNVNEILSKSKSIRFVSDDHKTKFNAGKSLVLKEKNKSSNDFDLIAQRLESNAVTITNVTKKPKTEKTNHTGDTETFCRRCLKEFRSPLELLRHSRTCHSYPKVFMALSEVKKFYSVKDRSACPICHKPLKINFRSVFVKHLLTHTNEMMHSCSVCNRKFRRSDHMKAHERRHVVKKK